MKQLDNSPERLLLARYPSNLPFIQQVSVSVTKRPSPTPLSDLGCR